MIIKIHLGFLKYNEHIGRLGQVFALDPVWIHLKKKQLNLIIPYKSFKPLVLELT